MPKKSIRDMTRWERMSRSLSGKTLLATLAMTLILSLAAVTFGFMLYATSVNREYRVNTWNISRTASHAIDTEAARAKSQQVLDIYDGMSEAAREKDDSPEYLSMFDSVMDDDMDALRKELHLIQTDNNMAAGYIAALDPETDRLIFIADGDPEDTFCPPGTWDAMESDDIDALINGSYTLPLDGLYGVEPMPSIITRMEQYGYRCTACTKLFDINGYPVYVLYDCDLNQVASASGHFLIQYLLLVLLVAGIITAFMVYQLRDTVVTPINRLADAAAAYTRGKRDDHDGKYFESLDIHTGDEIENLSIAMSEMESELSDYMQDLTKITADKERIETELGIASQIQEGMLPNIFPPFPDRSEFDLYASMSAAKEVGGDFYDFFLIDDDHLGIVMADVAGKGVPAALFMMASKILIKNFATMVTMSPASVLEKVNHQICLSNGEDMFVTAWLGVLEISTGTIKAANAGHEYPAVCIGSNHFELLHDKHGFVLGGMDGMRYNEYEIKLNAGDTLFLYTDGVPETTGPDKAMFGTGRMLKALDEKRGSSAKDMLKHLSKVLEEFKGENDQFDDLTMLAINYKGNGGKKKTFEAVTANLPAVLEFIDSELEAAGCGMKQQLQIDVSVEELFVNICNYAYAPETGNVVIGVKVTDDPKTAEVTFADTGMPYDPFARKDPDITLPAEQREIGGLGVLMVRKSMDETYYEYTDGQNKVTIRKAI